MPIFGVPSFKNAAYEVTNSGDFEASESDYLYKTYAGAPTSQRIFTIAAWIKRESTGGQMYWAGASTNELYLGFNSDKFLWHVSSSNYKVESVATYTDTANWHHFALVVDTTNATAADRFKIYYDGTRITSITESQPTQNYDTAWGTAVQHQVGQAFGFYYDGLIADFVYLDGTAVTDTGGVLDELITGAGGSPKDPSGLNFGTNGFWLDFKASGDLGNDASGLNNDYTNSGVTQSADAP